MDLYHWTVAILGIVYGIAKFVIGCMALFMPDSLRHKLHSDKFWRMIFSTDTSLAAQVIEIALIVFGIYTIANSLDILGIVKLPFINTKTFLYTFYTVIGISLTLFYYLVIYTNLPIPKNEEYTVRYKIIGLVGGLLFLITTPIYILYHQIRDYGIWDAPFVVLGCIFSILFILAMVAVVIYDAFKSRHRDKKIKPLDLLLFVFIPIGWS